MMSYPLAETVRRARDLHEGDRAALAADLRTGIAGEVRTERPYRLLYATDASLYQMEPAAVVFPASAADVQHTLQVAAKAGVPVLPRGGGTSLAGQGVNHAIVLDFTPSMGGILEINREEAWARLQPGVVLAELNRAAAPLGLQYPIDPSTANRATIGGGIGNNSCGAHSVIYGKTLDQVIDLEAVLADATKTSLHSISGGSLEAKLRQSGLEGQIYRELRRIGIEQREEVERRFPKIMRRVSGYNLDSVVQDGESMDIASMVVGSEGTLAIVTEARLRLVPVPKVKALAAVHFRGVVEAAEANLAALEHNPSSVELMDSVIVRRCRSNPSLRHLASYVVGDPGALLLIEFYADTEAEGRAKLERLDADLKRRGLGYATVMTMDPAQQRDMWRMREAGLGLIMSVRGDAKPVGFVEDAAVAPEKLPAFLERFQEVVANHGTEAAYYGHASVGCMHIRPMVNVKSVEGLRMTEAIATAIADLVLEFRGSLSGEHGDGILRGVFTERMFGPTLTNAFREIKRAFDPQGLLNPGKIIDTPAFSENLRLSPRTRNWEPVTYLDFSAEGGIARAVEQCNGQGACRKLDGGMCPSFMVTRDEEHSTRGRANLLRMVFSGMLPAKALAGDRLHAALDLCVECKACKAECPSGVDMAKLKYEALAQRQQARGVPLRARIFAYIALLSRFGAYAGPIANRSSRLAPARALMQRFVGIHKDRPLPAFASETFSAWFGRHSASSPHPSEGVGGRGSGVGPTHQTTGDRQQATDATAPEGGSVGAAAPGEPLLAPERVGHAQTTCPTPDIRHPTPRERPEVRQRGDVVFFPDTFTNYYHPEVGRAAVRVLEALGYRVVLAENLACCGRPAISKGMLPTAKRWARQNVDALLPYARRGVPIVGTEPSCILTFRDEYPDLLRNESSRTVAGQTFLLDELVAKLVAEDPSLRSLFRDDLKREVLVHAHCHQKAIAGPEPTLTALRLVPGYTVRLIESNCCGMAGSFGFEAEHYEISRAMGALRLFPAIEAASADTAITITGVSCRQQIGHFTARRPKHAVELLAEALR